MTDRPPEPPRLTPRPLPADVERLVRGVLALPELELRVRRLAEFSSQPPELCAPVLSGVCEGALVGNARAREALLPLALYLAGLVDWEGAPEDPQRRALRTCAERLALWPLERLLRVGPDTSTAEAVALDLTPPAVPDYGVGRELTLGERRSLARRPTRFQLERLLRDPHPMVIEQLLASPKMTEADVLRLATHRPPRRVALATLVRSVRWLSRPRVRLALVLQPSCPLGVSIPLLHTCVRGDLWSVVQDPALPAPLRSAARELVERAPPLGAPSASLH